MKIRLKPNFHFKFLRLLVPITRMITKRSFFQQLGLISLGTALLLFLLHRLPGFDTYQEFSWISLIIFILLSILMYFMGIRTAVSKDRNAFTRTVLGITGGKMFLAIVMVVMYVEIRQPISRHFLLPFFIVYFVYTIYETYFMMNLSHVKPENNEEQ
ncbi:MAG TPA: hypothetical protein ENK52_06890 [Saprospiraceae bacterium]|nr:hypothetical protein [Saprospiraceae bacterium]